MRCLVAVSVAKNMRGLSLAAREPVELNFWMPYTPIKPEDGSSSGRKVKFFFFLRCPGCKILFAPSHSSYSHSITKPLLHASFTENFRCCAAQESLKCVRLSVVKFIQSHHDRNADDGGGKPPEKKLIHFQFFCEEGFKQGRDVGACPRNQHENDHAGE